MRQFLALGLISLTGCTGYRDPAISLMEARLHERTDEAIAVHFTLNLENPNDDPLELTQFKYDLRIDGRKVYSGIRAAQATLAADGQRQMTIPAVLRFDRLGWDAQALPTSLNYEVSGKLEYATPGEIQQILFETGVHRPKAGFEEAGELRLE